MESGRFQELTDRYPKLRLGVLGDFCLDRYLEIDPEKRETSIETGLPVHNVMNVRAQAGGAGTILNNLAALGIGKIYPIGFVGVDGEGFELWNALEKLPGVLLDGMVRTNQRRTFTYCKPLVIWPGRAPEELNRLDSKNWTPTPAQVQVEISAKFHRLAPDLDGLIVLDQVDIAETGVVTARLLATLASGPQSKLKILGDSRRGLQHFPPVMFKMNAAELSRLTANSATLELADIAKAAAELAGRNQQPVFVTLAERGIVAAMPSGDIAHVTSLPLRGPIDVVGAGDCVSANLIAALCAGATLQEALELANAAASVVIHKLGTTGTASVAEIFSLLNQ